MLEIASGNSSHCHAICFAIYNRTNNSHRHRINKSIIINFYFSINRGTPYLFIYLPLSPEIGMVSFYPPPISANPSFLQKMHRNLEYLIGKLFNTTPPVDKNASLSFHIID